MKCEETEIEWEGAGRSAVRPRAGRPWCGGGNQPSSGRRAAGARFSDAPAQGSRAHGLRGDNAGKVAPVGERGVDGAKPGLHGTVASCSVLQLFKLWTVLVPGVSIGLVMNPLRLTQIPH